MKLKQSALVIGGVVASIFASDFPAQALTWTLNNVQFEDGATATGSFDYDATNNVLISDAIVISRPLFGNINFTNGNSKFLSSTAFKLVDDFLGLNSLRLNFSSALSDTAAQNTNIPLLTSSEYTSLIFFTSSLTQGSVTANPTPIPWEIPGGATIPVLGSVLALGLMRQVKKGMAARS